MGRSGTRNTANVLNAHEHVKLFGEMPTGITKALFSLLTTVDRTYAKKDYHRELWAAKKAEFLFAAFDHIGKAPRAPADAKPAARYVGHKTPHHELLFDEYESHCGSVGLAPVYFYCARDPRGCWRSYKSMPWNTRTLEGFLAEYEASYRQLDAMLEHCPERVHVVKLNGLMAAEDQVEWYARTLFAPLGLNMSDTLAAEIATLRNNNATVRVTGQAPVELTPEEVELIEGNPAIRRIEERHFSSVVA